MGKYNEFSNVLSMALRFRLSALDGFKKLLTERGSLFLNQLKEFTS
jgi:hypothetical protein